MDAPRATDSPAFEFYWLRLPQAFVAHRDFPRFAHDGSILATLAYLCFRINRKSGRDGCFLTWPTALESIAQWCGVHFGTAQRAVDKLCAWKPDGNCQFLEKFVHGGGRISTVYRFNFLALTRGTVSYARGVAPAPTQPAPGRSPRVSAGAHRYTTDFNNLEITTAGDGAEAANAVVFQILRGIGIDEEGIRTLSSYGLDKIERARDYTLAKKPRPTNLAGYFRRILTMGYAERPGATPPVQKPAAKKATPPPVHSAKRPATKPAEAEIDTTTDVFTQAKARLKSAPKPVPQKRRSYL